MQPPAGVVTKRVEVDNPPERVSVLRAFATTGALVHVRLWPGSGVGVRRRLPLSRPTPPQPEEL